MTGIVERIGALAGTEWHQAANFAHDHFNARMGVHNHVGRSLVETVVEVCRNHPNLIGIAAGVAVQQLLAEEKRRHDAHHDAPPEADTPPPPPHAAIQLSQLRPGRVAMEVFGALLLLKLAATGARMFRHKHQGEAWFAPAARIRLFSGAIATYYVIKALKSPRLSAWRNAAILLFGTDAVKPLMRESRR